MGAVGSGAIPRRESRWGCETQGLQPLRIRCAGPVVLATRWEGDSIQRGQRRSQRRSSASRTVTNVYSVLSTAR